MTSTPLRKTSHGRTRYNSIKNDTKIGVDTKNLNKLKYSATSAEKIVTSTEYGHYKIKIHCYSCWNEITKIINNKHLHQYLY